MSGSSTAGPVAGPHAVRRLGEVLVAHGLLSSDDLAWALEIQARTGSRLGSILIASGKVRRLALHQALAQEWGAEFLDLTAVDFEPDLLDGLDPAALARVGWIPIRTEGDTVLCATCEPPSPELARAIAADLGRRVRLAVTTDWDIGEGLRRGYRETVLEEAALGLWHRDENQSARSVLTDQQRIGFMAALVGAACGLVLAPMTTIMVGIAALSVAFLVAVVFKLVVCVVGAGHELADGVSDSEVAALDDRDLPIYTVLVPVYREANVVADLIGNLGALDYPAHKLEILLLLEEDDNETLEAARAAAPPETIRFIVVPDGHPKTKPKACNVGLFFARGDYLVIYDAEDRPDPDQLKKAVVAFERAGDELVCVQAALNYWNAGENWLTRMFTLEYSFWFDYMLPGLDRLRLPIPLGGTSNHFRTDALRRLGGWDPFNVTEDADLGIRASMIGYTVGVLNSTTFEEANRDGHNWVRQRSRWIKGYIQTLLVHLRQPGRLGRTVGARRGTAFALLIGGTPLTFLATPPLLALFVASFLVDGAWFSQLFPGWVLLLCLVNLLLGNAAMVYVSMMGAFKRRRYRLVAWAVLNPIYWLLHAAASYKALWQLITKPHYWEKTLHGLSTLDAEPAGPPAIGDAAQPPQRVAG